jgi:WD40 repeat protein
VKSKDGVRVDADKLPLPEGAITRLGTTRLSHVGEVVRTLCFTPDDKHVISAGDGPIRVWDVNTGKQVRAIGTGRTAALSGDGRLLAVGCHGEKRTGAILDFASGKVIGRFGGENWSVASCFAPKGKTLAACYGHTEIDVIDSTSGKVIRSISTHSRTDHVLIMPDGETLISAGSGEGPDGKKRAPFQICSWNIDTGKLARSIETHSDGIARMALSRDGSRLATVAYQITQVEKNSWTMGHVGEVVIWDTTTGKKVRTINATKPKDGLRFVEFTGDGKGLITGEWDGGTVSLWDIATGEKIREIYKSPCLLWSMALSHDGQTFAIGDNEGTISLHSLANRKALVESHGHRARVMSVSASVDGKHIATAGSDGIVCLWDAATGNEVRRWTEKKGINWHARFSPDAKSIVWSTYDNDLCVYDLATGKIKILLNQFGYPTYAPNGKTIALDRASNIVLVDSQTGKKRDLGGTAGTLAFTSDGRALFAWSYDGEIHAWNLETGKVQKRRPDRVFTSDAWRAAFSPDCKLVALGSDEGFVPVFDNASGKEHCRFTGLPRGFRGTVGALAFSPDSRWLAWGDFSGFVRIGDVATGKEIHSFDTRAGMVNCLTFAADGKTLISGGSDTTALVWDLTTVKSR